MYEDEQEHFEDEQEPASEVTLGTGRLLGLFFGLVVLCGVFFSLGYSMGRVNAADPAKTESANHAESLKTEAVAQIQPAAAATPEKSDLGFYKAVEEQQPKAELSKPEPVAEVVTSAPTPKITAAKAAKKSAPMATAAPGFVVQVAAISKVEDAQALAGALRKKQYPVFLANSSSDRLVRVQVGPFADMKDAEAMRARLIGDGYNAILKK